MVSPSTQAGSPMQASARLIQGSFRSTSSFQMTRRRTQRFASDSRIARVFPAVSCRFNRLKVVYLLGSRAASRRYFMRKRLFWAAILTLAAVVFAAEEPNFATWENFLSGPDSSQYSSLKQITKNNV